jgi:putative acetyltransferase
MSVSIASERPDSADAAALIAKLEAELELLYPPESRHGLSVAKLIERAVALFVLRDHDVPAGCCGIQFFDTTYAELKRLYVLPQFRSLGYGEMLVSHSAEYARAHCIGLLRLETGIHQTAAIRLYERMGFHRIPPFGPYKEDAVSLCYQKRLM